MIFGRSIHQKVLMFKFNLDFDNNTGQWRIKNVFCKKCVFHLKISFFAYLFLSVCISDRCIEPLLHNFDFWTFQWWLKRQKFDLKRKNLFLHSKYIFFFLCNPSKPNICLKNSHFLHETGSNLESFFFIFILFKIMLHKFIGSKRP